MPGHHADHHYFAKMLLGLIAIALLQYRCAAQTALFQPMSLTVSNSALGAGRDIGLWTVAVDLPPGTTRSRISILMAAPGVRAIPNRFAAVLLERKAYRDPRSVLLRVGQAALLIAPVALAAAGVTTGKPGYSWSAVGTSALGGLLSSLRPRAPDASLISAADLLPEVVSGSGQWYIVASLSPHAAPIGPVRIP